MYLQRVLREHPGTPWALLARTELATPLHWKWDEQFTDLSPPPPRPEPAVNRLPRGARDDRPRVVAPPPPKRPPPKL
jgi:hypothetical protein